MGYYADGSRMWKKAGTGGRVQLLVGLDERAIEPVLAELLIDEHGRGDQAGQEGDGEQVEEPR